MSGLKTKSFRLQTPADDWAQLLKFDGEARGGPSAIPLQAPSRACPKRRRQDLHRLDRSGWVAGAGAPASRTAQTLSCSVPCPRLVAATKSGKSLHRIQHSAGTGTASRRRDPGGLYGQHGRPLESGGLSQECHIIHSQKQTMSQQVPISAAGGHPLHQHRARNWNLESRCMGLGTAKQFAVGGSVSAQFRFINTEGS